MAMATGTLCIWSPAQKPPSPQKSYRLLSNEKKSGRKAYSLSLPPWPSCPSCHGMYGIHALSSLSSHHSILPEISFLSSTTHRTLVAFLKCIFLRSYLYDLCLAFFLLLFFFSPINSPAFDGRRAAVALCAPEIGGLVGHTPYSRRGHSRIECIKKDTLQFHILHVIYSALA